MPTAPNLVNARKIVKRKLWTQGYVGVETTESSQLLGVIRVRHVKKTPMQVMPTLIFLLAHKERVSTLSILPTSRLTASHNVRGRT